MNIKLLILKQYPLRKIIESGFSKLGLGVESIDYQEFFPKWRNEFKNRMSGFRRFKKRFEDEYYKKINEKYLNIFKSDKPDLLIIYNNQHIHPEVLAEIKKTTKIVFYLGDSPLYCHTNDYNLAVLNYSDLTICPDTLWIEQLEQIGIKNLHYGIIGYDNDIYFKYEPTTDDKINYTSDISFIGRNYHDSWGYKRAMFLSKFLDFDFKIYTTDIYWKKWNTFFPGLSEKTYPSKPYDNKFNNTVMNCSKIYPIDMNPGILNGIHLRVFEAIGSEVLPIVEYRKDLDIVFKDIKLPVVKNYDECKEMAGYYLKNDKERIVTIQNLKKHLDDNFRPEFLAKNIIDKLF